MVTKDFSKFDCLVIAADDNALNNLDIVGGSWNKRDVLIDLVDNDIISNYIDKIGWARYIVNCALDSMDYDEKMIEMFLLSDTTSAIKLDYGEYGTITILKKFV